MIPIPFSLNLLVMLGLGCGWSEKAGISRNDVADVQRARIEVASGEKFSGKVVSVHAASVVIEAAGEEPARFFGYDKATQIVDEDEQPISIARMKAGIFVTVHSTMNDGRSMASRVIIHPQRRTPFVAEH